MPVASNSLLKRRRLQNVLGVHPSGNQKDAGRKVPSRDCKETEGSIILVWPNPSNSLFDYFNICTHCSDVVAPFI
jgi:hypothetical protein